MHSQSYTLTCYKKEKQSEDSDFALSAQSSKTSQTLSETSLPPKVTSSEKDKSDWCSSK